MPFAYDITRRDGKKYTVLDNGTRLTSLRLNDEKLEKLLGSTRSHALDQTNLDKIR
jgi:hypothetical protein